jgi:alpha-methylacyl-CoA racemase
MPPALNRPPLDGIRVVDLTTLSPGPFCSMMLADFGAEVIRIEPIGGGRNIPLDPMGRGKKSLCVNLTDSRGAELVRRLASTADVFVEGFRPGVVERLGLSYAPLRDRNPAIVYCSVTGWGQEGPAARTAGHDINYLARSGALAPIGRRGLPPNPPLNLVGDMGGGGLLAAFGIVTALLARSHTGNGQYIDAAMLDGAALLNIQTMAVYQAGMPVGRGTGYLDSGAPFYDCYETSDGKFMAVGAIEAKFFDTFWRLIGAAGTYDQNDTAQWPRVKDEVARQFRTRSRDEWVSVFAEADACVSPVLELNEVAHDAHNQSRHVFGDHDGVVLPNAAPCFAGIDRDSHRPAPAPGQHSTEILRSLSCTAAEIETLRADGVVA